MRLRQITNYHEQQRLAAEAMRDFPIPGKTEGCICSNHQPLAYQGSYICTAGCPIHDPGNAYAR